VRGRSSWTKERIITSTKKLLFIFFLEVELNVTLLMSFPSFHQGALQVPTVWALPTVGYAKLVSSSKLFLE